MENVILIGALIMLGVFALAVLVRLVLGPRVTDRILAINAVNVLIIGMICLLSVYLKADYLVDVALIYGLLGFTVNTLLTRTLISNKRKEDKK